MDIPDFTSADFSVKRKVDKTYLGRKIYLVTHNGNEWDIGQESMEYLRSFNFENRVDHIAALGRRLKEYISSLAETSEKETIVVSKEIGYRVFAKSMSFLYAKYCPFSKNWISKEKQDLYLEIDRISNETFSCFPGMPSHGVATLDKDLWNKGNTFTIEGEAVELEVGEMYWIESPHFIRIAKFRHKSASDYWFTNHEKKIIKIPHNSKSRFFKLRELP